LVLERVFEERVLERVFEERVFEERVFDLASLEAVSEVGRGKPAPEEFDQYG
jgi:hypothetical protein